MNLTRQPIYAKPEKVERDFEYMAEVKMMPCRACGRPGPNEAHHCRDLPDFNERGLYQRLPGAGRKSGDRDTISLCTDDHRLFHLNRAEFHARYGKDYGFIAPTRAFIARAEVDF